MFNKILIANRGEIACRIAKSCKKLGIGTVAIYSNVDANARHVALCDEKYCLGGNEAKDTYLSIPKILKAAKELGVDAVHPGYGFLSENPEFARELTKNNITFVGPKAETIELMGDKVSAKSFAEQCKIPLVPGVDCEEKIEKFIKDHGFPILIKAAAGGGGRGMRKVYKKEELADALAGAKREAQAFFNDGRLFIEKLVENGRHIEVQIFGDQHGGAIHLWDRDCTAQRRHQKVIEEAPANLISLKVREEILKGSVTLCKEAGYIGAGTVEFLVAPTGEYYFLEVNSRLQVEHPVTEEVLGFDLVELQIRVAAGQKLSQIIGEGYKPKGHAIECRVCAESPEDDFRTSTGKILYLNSDLVNQLPGVRIDYGFERNDQITHYYDSLLAKVIVKGDSRKSAIEHAKNALRNFHICGIKTNIPYLLRILESSDFQGDSFHINLAESLIPGAEELNTSRALVGALFLLTAQFKAETNQPDPWNRYFGWRQLASEIVCSLKVNDQPISFKIECGGRGTFRILTAENELLWHLSKAALTPNGSFSFLLEGTHHGCSVYSFGGRNFIATHLGLFEIENFHPALKSAAADGEHSGELTSPFPGKIVSVNVQSGSSVEAGEPLLVLESMKMEHPIKAPFAGTVVQVLVSGGEVIEANKLLVKLSFVA